MDHVQTDYWKMLNASSDCMLKNIVKWGPNPVIQTVVDKLLKANVNLHTYHIIQLSGSSDATLIIKEDRELLEKSVCKVKNGIIAYSNSTKDRTYFKSISLSDSDIRALSENDFLDFSTMLYNAAVELGIKLVPFLVLEADVLLFKSRLDIFSGDLGGKRNKVTSIVAATIAIEKEISAVKELLHKELDPIIENYIETEPDFYNEYKSARKLIHYGIHHRKPEATVNSTVIDAKTKLPLYFVDVLIVETKEKTQTDVNGMVILQFAKAGVYTIKYTKPGYEDLIQNNVELGIGDVLELKIQLTALVTPITI